MPCGKTRKKDHVEKFGQKKVKVYFNLKPRAKAGPRGEGLDPETVIDPMCVLRRPVHQETWKTGALNNLPLWRDA